MAKSKNPARNGASSYINRELSWLEFNQRVLDEARDASLPLLERLKFLAITGSNLDEFFRVRVGGLQMLSKQGKTRRDPSGLTPKQQLAAISKRAHRMRDEQYQCLLEELEPALAEAGVRRTLGRPLGTAASERQAEALERVFEDEIYAVLTPMAVSREGEFPLLANQMLHVCVRLGPASSNPQSAIPGAPWAPQSNQPRFALIPLGRSLSRFVTLPSAGGYEYMLLEDVVHTYVSRFFPGEEVMECVPFRITRNADLAVREDAAPDLMAGMEKVLDARKHGDCVRLEVSDQATSQTRQFLDTALAIKGSDVYTCPGPLGLADFFKLADLSGYETLKYEPWPPQPSPLVDPSKTMFENIAARDLLLYHPYESFEPVVRLVEEAADDADVLAIKQILYRTSRNSPIVAALARAAENGKHVTVIVELKARFDEERNIEWAKALEQSGVQVIYGVRGLKTHAKTCIVVRREPHGMQRYVHFGTGNYNEATARLYSDASLLTCDEDLGADAIAFFNSITGYSQPQRLRKLRMAPIDLRDSVLEQIHNETERKRHGQKALILAKMNSLVDPAIIDALYEASQAGVDVRLNVRGICCLRPGVKGLSENIQVVSIVDRFLEHARIFYFRHGGDDLVYISSADWMPRNLDRRVELLVPVEDYDSKQRLMSILETHFKDTAKARRLQPDGSFERVKPAGRGSHKWEPTLQSQRALYERAACAVQQARQSRRDVFEPHRSPAAR